MEIPRLVCIDLEAQNAERARRYSEFIRYMLDNTELRFDDIAWKYRKIADGATCQDLMFDLFARRKNKK